MLATGAGAAAAGVAAGTVAIVAGACIIEAGVVVVGTLLLLDMVSTEGLLIADAVGCSGGKDTTCDEALPHVVVVGCVVVASSSINELLLLAALFCKSATIITHNKSVIDHKCLALSRVGNTTTYQRLFLHWR
jgi:hypothetical protein